MGVQTRGGIPRIKHLTVTTAGEGARPYLFNATSMYIYIRPRTNALRLFFSKADFDADENYWPLAVDELFEGPVEEKQIWMKAVTADSTVELMVLHRKG